TICATRLSAYKQVTWRTMTTEPALESVPYRHIDRPQTVPRTTPPPHVCRSSAHSIDNELGADAPQVYSDERTRHEQSSSAGRYAEGCVRADRRRRARALGGERTPLRRVGAVSREGIAGRSQPYLRLAELRM